MSDQARVIPAFVIAKTELLLRVFQQAPLERSLHAPTTERRQRQIVQRLVRRSVAHEIFDLPLTNLALIRFRPRFRLLRPGPKRTRNLADEKLIFRIKLSQELRLASVTFVEGRSLELDSVFRCAIVLFQGDLPFRRPP